MTTTNTDPGCAPSYAHRWTREGCGCGGCAQNPGVRSLGGTTYRYEARCVVCGVRRVETRYGSQRNPGERDSVSYEVGDVDPVESSTEQRRQRRNRAARHRRAIAAALRAPAVQSALEGLVGCPVGGWPETRQAETRLGDELPRGVRAREVIALALREDASGRYQRR